MLGNWGYDLVKPYLAIMAVPSTVTTTAAVVENKTKNKLAQIFTKIIQISPLALFTASNLQDRYFSFFYKLMGGKYPDRRLGEVELREFYETMSPIYNSSSKYAKNLTYATFISMLCLPIMLEGTQVLAKKYNFHNLEKVCMFSEKIVNLAMKIFTTCALIGGLAMAVAINSIPFALIYGTFTTINIYYLGLTIKNYCFKE